MTRMTLNINRLKTQKYTLQKTHTLRHVQTHYGHFKMQEEALGGWGQYSGSVGGRGCIEQMIK